MGNLMSMKGSANKLQRSTCPINIALEALGDGWSLLIVRDLMFKGRKTYQEFLGAEEGIASNILADRLQRLVALNILSKRKDPDDARKYVYQLTEIGIGLAPMLLEMILWSAKHFDTAAPPDVVAEMTTRRDRFLATLRKNWSKTAR